MPQPTPKGRGEKENPMTTTKTEAAEALEGIAQLLDTFERRRPDSDNLREFIEQIIGQCQKLKLDLQTEILPALERVGRYFLNELKKYEPRGICVFRETMNDYVFILKNIPVPELRAEVGKIMLALIKKHSADKEKEKLCVLYLHDIARWCDEPERGESFGRLEKTSVVPNHIWSDMLHHGVYKYQDRSYQKLMAQIRRRPENQTRYLAAILKTYKLTRYHKEVLELWKRLNPPKGEREEVKKARPDLKEEIDSIYKTTRQTAEQIAHLAGLLRWSDANKDFPEPENDLPDIEITEDDGNNGGNEKPQ